MPLAFHDAACLSRKRTEYFFFSNEGQPREPPHIHVRGGGRDAKIWVETDLSLAEATASVHVKSRNIMRIVAENRDLILRAWDDHFGDGGLL